MSKKSKKSTLSIRMDAETFAHMQELCETLKGSYSSIVGLAIATLYHEHPLIQSKHRVKTNGQHVEE